jgi:hypothetical protein
MEVPQHTCMWTRLSSLLKIYVIMFNLISLTFFYPDSCVEILSYMCVIYHYNICYMEPQVMPFLYKSTSTIQLFLSVCNFEIEIHGFWLWLKIVTFILAANLSDSIYNCAICVQETKFWTHISIMLQVPLLSYCEKYMKIII